MTQGWATFVFEEDGQERRFKDFEKFDQWLVLERERWEWLHSAASPFGNVGANIINSFETLRQQARQIRDGGHDLQAIAGNVAQHYRQDGWLMLSEGKTAATLAHLRARFGDRAAAFAFAFKRQHVNLQSANDPNQLAATVLLSMPELDKPAELAARLQQERASYRAATRTTLDRLEADEAARVQRVRHRSKRGVRFLVDQLRRTRKLNDTLQLNVQGNVVDAISSIRTVEETYRVSMGLKAPVEYWRDKAEKHRTAEGKAFTHLLFFFPIAFMVFASAFGLAAYLLLDADKVHQTVYLIVAAGLASMAALIFWVGRLLTKLYLSQHHLRHDADERAVMTTTYLALTHESAATEEDKKIILASLFRPTSDGLVKDDGPSDLTLAGVLSKIGAGR